MHACAETIDVAALQLEPVQDKDRTVKIKSAEYVRLFFARNLGHLAGPVCMSLNSFRSNFFSSKTVFSLINFSKILLNYPNSSRTIPSEQGHRVRMDEYKVGRKVEYFVTTNFARLQRQRK